MTELRFAFSRLLKHPGVTVVAMLTLALEGDRRCAAPPGFSSSPSAT